MAAKYKSITKTHAQSRTPMISVIAIINSTEPYENWLKSGLDQQDFNSYELILVNNQDNTSYQDARAALNDASEVASGKYIVYIHQDMRFLSEDAIRKIYEYAEKIDEFGVLGVAGAPIDYRQPICSSIVHGAKKQIPGIRIDSPIEVMTVDECLFVIKRSTWKQHHFSDDKGWHLYAVEYCLDMLDAGKRNYVIPIPAWHASEGTSAGPVYCKAVKPYLKRYRNKYRCINTTMKPWRTGWGGVLYLQYYTLKQYIKKLLTRS